MAETPTASGPPGARASVPWEPQRERLARALGPAISSRLRRITKDYESLTSALERDPARLFADEDTLGVLDQLEPEVRPVGWALGVLAASAGANVLRARRERLGLRYLAELLEEAHAWRRLEPPLSALPELEPAGEGWELCFASALLLLSAAETESEPVRWTLTKTGTSVRFAARFGDRESAAAHRLALASLRELGGEGKSAHELRLELSTEDDWLALSFPAELVP